MGATTFTCSAAGKTAKEAFENARAVAQHQRGHGGYTGTIAEKNSFTMIVPPAYVLVPPSPEAPRWEHPVHKFIQELIEKADPRIDDKWGPAGCIAMPDGVYIFFGWASE